MRIVWWLATVVAVGIVSVALSHRHALDPVENLSLTVSAPAQMALRDVTSPVADVWDGIIDRGSLVRENRELLEEIELLKAQLAEQQENLQRIRELEDALAVRQDRPDDQLLASRVIAQELTGLKRTIAIDRGSNDGVDDGMIVLSRNGTLIGTVYRSFPDFAWIRLIDDPSSVVNAQVNVDVPQPVQPSPPPVLTPDDENEEPTPTPEPEPEEPDTRPVRGVLKGDLRHGLVLELIPSDAVIEDGSLVVTSGLGGNYPPGILIGSVRTADQRPQAPFTRAQVTPAAQLTSLDTVLVVISFRPARLVEP